MISELDLDADTRLMLLVQRDDDASFGTLVQKYRVLVVQYLSRKVQNRDIAEELAQEVFLRIYSSRHAYQPSARFTTWLFRISTNVALNHLRDERYPNQNISLDAPISNGKYFETPDRRCSVEQLLLLQNTEREIREAIAALPPKQRAAVLLHKYEGMGYCDVAVALNMSRAALKALMFRSYERLRTSLAHLEDKPRRLARKAA